MKILSLERLNGPGSTLALASVQISSDVRAHNIRLVRGHSGDLRVYPPNSSGVNALTFSPAAILELKKIVIEAYECEEAKHDRHCSH